MSAPSNKDWSKAVSGFTPAAGGGRELQDDEPLLFEAEGAYYDGTSARCGVDLPPPPKVMDRLGGLRRKGKIGLPGLSGFEVAKRLRQQPALRDAVLVALTGYGRESDRQRSREAGFDHHLVKPGDFGKVLEILATVSESPGR